MNDIEQTAISTYKENLNYFEKSHPELFKKIDLLNQAVAQGLYSEKYSLEYFDNYFDVMDLKTKSFFYNTNSVEHAKKLADSVSLKKDENTIEAFYNFNFANESAEILDSLPLQNNRMGAIASLLDYINKNTNKKSLMKSIPKFIFPGIGLGIHIPYVVKKYNSLYIWIIEDDLELFRLSLFTTNYSNLSKNRTLRFSIQTSDAQLSKDFDLYLLEGFADNNYLKYCLLSDFYSNKISLIQSFIVNQQYLFYPFYKMLARDISAPKYIAERYNILDFQKKCKNSIFEQKPIMVIAAGPSLDKNAQWLYENQDKFIIICVMASLKTLTKNRIKPHIVVHTDPSAQSINFLDDDSYAFVNETVFLFATYTLDPLVKLFSPKQVFFFEQGVNYKHDNLAIYAPSVGETVYAVSLLLEAKNIYLLGLDLALDQETGMTHAKDHIRSTISTNEVKENVYSLHESKLMVKGNFADKVQTISVLKQSIDRFTSLTHDFKKPNQIVYNLNAGAYLEDAIPTKIDEVNITSKLKSNFQEEILYIKKCLLEISSNKPSVEDKKIVQERIDIARKIKLYCEAYANIEINTAKDFVESISLLLSKITLQKNQMDETRAIFTYFIRYVIGYISAFFNTQDIDDEDYHAAQINKILIKQIFKILDTYIDELSKHIKNY